MKKSSKNYTLIAGASLSMIVSAITAAKYVYLWNAADIGEILRNTTGFEREFFLHFYDWIYHLRPAFLLHIVFGGIALAAGPIQFIPNTKIRSSLHKISGTVYVISVILSSSGGFIIAQDAAGGSISRYGFSTASLLWMGTLLLSVRYLIRSDFNNHSLWMKINFSLTFAAVTLRLEFPVLLAAGMDPSAAYGIVAWLCWIPNLVLAVIHTDLLKLNRRVEL